MDTISSVSYSRACGLVLTSARGHRITFDEDVAGFMLAYSPDTPSFAPQRSTPPTAPSWRHLTSHGGTKHEDGSILLGLARRQADSGPAHDPRSCSQTHPTLALRSAIHTDGTPRFRVADLSGAIHRRRGHDGDSHMKEAVSIWAILAMVAIVIGSGVAETIATRFLQ